LGQERQQPQTATMEIVVLIQFLAPLHQQVAAVAESYLQMV
jgi:hypothetical protein